MTSEPTNAKKSELARSATVRALLLQQLEREIGVSVHHCEQGNSAIPRKILQYWHDLSELPDDVLDCMNSWKKLEDHGFEFFLHDDVSAAEYIAVNYGPRERAAFARCAHPAMRSDYLRLCFIVAEGGLYVDVDDVLIGDNLLRSFDNNLLKVQPLCYDISAGGMMQAIDIWNPAIRSEGRNFYVNNDPLIAPPRHPLLIGALARATDKLLENDTFLEIQATTGPGNLTITLVAHAMRLLQRGLPLDFEFLKDWDSIAEVRWQLSYRSDERNWRNVYGC